MQGVELGLFGPRVMIAWHVVGQQAREHHVAEMRFALALQADAPADLVDIEQHELLVVGIAAMLFEFGQQLAVAQNENAERTVARDEGETVEVAAQLFHFAEQMRGKGHRAQARHMRETTDLELTVAKEGLTQAARLLQADQKHVRTVGADTLQEPFAQHRQRIDTRHRYFVLEQGREPGCQHFGARDRGQQHPRVASAFRLTTLGQRVVVGRTAKQARVLARQHRAPIARADVRHRVLAVFLLDHIDQHAHRRRRDLFQTALEQGIAVVIGAKNIGLRELSAIEQIEDRPVTADQEHTRLGGAKN